VNGLRGEKPLVFLEREFISGAKAVGILKNLWLSKVSPVKSNEGHAALCHLHL
jgi:hypothetical protein